MAEQVIGKIGLTPKGEYVSGELYDILDMVSHEGNSYVSKIQNNNIDVTNTEAWLLAAKKGEDGESIKGDKGDTFTFEDLTTEQKEELKGDVIIYNSMTESDKDDFASRVPITGVVEEGNTQAVSGGEVFAQGYLDRETGVEDANLFNTEIKKSRNLLNPDEALIDKWFTSPTETSASSIRDWGGRWMSNYIKVEPGKSYKAYGMATATNRRILGFANKGDIYAKWFFSAYNSSPTGVFTIPEDIDVNYVVVAISTSYPAFLNTGMIIEGVEEIPYEPYINEEVKSIKTELFPDYYNKQEVDEKISESDLIIDLNSRVELDNTIKSFTKNSQDINNNSKVKIGGNSETRFIANPLNVDVHNALIPIYIHSGENEGDYNERHFYLNNESENGFNDIRVKANNNVLNQVKISEIDYEFVFDSRIKPNTHCDNDGYLIFQDGDSIKISKNNLKTSDIVKTARLVGINNIGDIFYQNTANDGILRKTTKMSNYTDEDVVLNVGFSTTFYGSSFKFTEDGTIFLGNYQDAFNAKVWKSIDNGNTFTISLDQSSRQHIHSIIVDKTATPNTVYANIDGYISGSEPSQMALYKTTDLGDTWSQVSNPFPTDYGVLFAKDGKALGGGEGAVKGSPTIYVRDVLTNQIEIKLDNFQNTQKAFSLDEAVLTAGGGHSQCAMPILYFSENMFEDTKIIFLDRHINSTVMNRSYRGGSGEHPITPVGDIEQNFIYNSYEFAPNPPFRFKKNGNKQALFLIHVPLLPANGINIEVGNNYNGIGTDIDVFNNKIGDFLDIRYNDLGNYLFNSNLEGYLKNEDSNYDKNISKRFGILFPRKCPFLNLGATGNTEVNIEEFNATGKTIDLFYKNGAISYASNHRYIIRGNNLDVSRYSDSRLQINDLVKSSIFLRNSVREYLHLTFVFEATKILLYVNGYKSHEFETDTTNMTVNKIGNIMTVNTNSDLISNFKIHNKLMTQNEVLELYHGGVIV